MNKLVSIIIPVYNVEKYLTECINSALRQTYKNLEIILVNDGSIDNSLNICKNFKNIYKNIVLIDKKNGGASSARNEGIKRSTGEFIIFLDSDDYIDKNMVKTLVDNYYKYSADLVTSGINKIFFNENEIKKCISLTNDNAVIKGNKTILDYYYPIYDTKGFNSPCGKLYLSRIIKNNKIIFNENIKIGEDYLFNLEYIKYVKTLCVLDLSMYNYRIEFNYNTKSYEKDVYEKRLILWNETKKFYILNKLPDYSLYNLYIKFLYSQVIALNNPGCDLTKKEKKDLIKKIIIKDKTIEVLDNYSKINGTLYKTLALFVKFKLINTMMFVGNIIYKTKN